MSAPLRICIVTADIVGPIRNGGIGTAYYNLAVALARAGHRVTVLYTLGTYCENRNITHWRQHYRALGIQFVPQPPTRVQGHSAIKMAHGAYEWIKAREFDVVHCHEWRGIGFYMALGKKQGLCLQGATLCVGAHSPMLWCLEGMNQLADAEALEVDYMERQSVALADVLWTPSVHMREWLVGEGWTLPEGSVREPYILMDLVASDAGPAAPGSELVFFGRLETRKGLDLFCDALDRLVAAGTPPPLVTFLGKSSTVGAAMSEDYVQARAKTWPFAWQIVTSLDRDGAMDYLRGANRVAVLPSRLDNLPYTVLECLGSAIPFVASNIGGIPEMIRPEDRGRVLFALTAESMAARLAAVLRDGHAPAPLRISADETRAAWLAWHEEIGARAVARADDGNGAGADTTAPVTRHAPVATAPSHRTDAPDTPLVSVCISTRNRPAYLDAALASVRAQDYANIEVVVVDDGSDRADAVAYLASLRDDFAARGWQIVRQPNRYVGAARNAAIAAARGEYLLFMDDDNFAEPHEIGTFVRAARASGADVLTCFMHLFQSDRPTPPPAAPDAPIWPFLGGALGPGVLRNVFGDANAFFHRSVFGRIGGFHEEFGVSGEDWELLARASLHGLSIMVVPEPLVRYRQSSDGMLHTTSQHLNQMRALRPYLQLVPAHLRSLVHLAKTERGAPGPAAAAATPVAKLDHVRKAVVFGSGEAGRHAIDLAARCGWMVPYIVDNNPTMWNRMVHGKLVKSPDSLTSDPADLVIIGSLAGKPAISSQLERMGLAPGRQFVHFLDPVRRGNLVTQVQL